jgi:hypothetical protein
MPAVLPETVTRVSVSLAALPIPPPEPPIALPSLIVKSLETLIN